MEELRVEVLLVVEHAPEGVEKAAHQCHDRHILLLPTGQQRFVGGADLRAALDSHQHGHEERMPQVAVAGAADLAWGVAGSALPRPRVEPGMGDPWLGFQVLG
jgi:hypothetical protein